MTDTSLMGRMTDGNTGILTARSSSPRRMHSSGSAEAEAARLAVTGQVYDRPHFEHDNKCCWLGKTAAALILPPNNIELAGGVPEPRAGAAGTADGRAQVVQAMA